ncbi:hypothetical protein ACFWAR_00290 [Streptomyces sp. NPDC059917]|uniref:hypothetical protein n=1 Tax=Streptomyces sp. NPDC059917 TaxID=3347002 RepID=UPI003655499D
MDEPEADNPGEAQRQSKLSRHAKTWLGVLAGIAGIVGTAIVLIDRPPPPKPFTPADWANEANSACDENWGDILKANNTSHASTRAALDAQAAIGTADELPTAQLRQVFRTAADDLDQLTGQERMLKAELERIEVPKGHDTEISGLITAMNNVSNLDGALAGAFRKIADGVVPEGSYQENTDTRNKLSAEVNRRWSNLGASQCL